ncbi:hypothetical protein RUM44_000387 [Polyplax serrata]|uniref:Small ribosomal subunit protein mS26 n=1 Tax=Polyplax serrata TaxID=468196 RepID=A0ABR1B5A3_POLSC
MSRRPFWLGMAKSKMFVVKEKKKYPDDEEKELQRLKETHSIIVDSMMHFLRNENSVDAQNNDHTNLAVIEQKLLEQKIEESFIQNDVFNSVSASMRDKRLQEELQKQEEDISLFLVNKAEQTAEFIKKVDDMVKREKVKSLSYITEENLEEAVDNCLNNVVNYNYAIDINGNKYPGSETLDSRKLGVQTDFKEPSENTYNM